MNLAEKIVEKSFPTLGQATGAVNELPYDYRDQPYEYGCIYQRLDSTYGVHLQGERKYMAVNIDGKMITQFSYIDGWKFEGKTSSNAMLDDIAQLEDDSDDSDFLRFILMLDGDPLPTK